MTELFKLSVKLLVFSSGFQSSVGKCLKNSGACFEVNIRLSLLPKRIFENQVRQKIPYIHWTITWLFVIYILPITVEAIPWGIRAVSSQLITLATYVKYLNSDLTISIGRKKQKWRKRDRRIRLNRIFQSRK